MSEDATRCKYCGLPIVAQGVHSATIQQVIARSLLLRIDVNHNSVPGWDAEAAKARIEMILEPE
jgi:hypothetical protein